VPQALARIECVHSTESNGSVECLDHMRFGGVRAQSRLTHLPPVASLKV